MPDDPRIDSFFADGPWQAELVALRKTLLSEGLTETFKWSSPVYCHDNANVAIVWIIGVAVGENAERLGALTLWLGAGLLLINLGGYVAGWYSGGLLRLDTPSRRALTLEIGMQNAGVGTMQALSLFPDPLAAVGRTTDPGRAAGERRPAGPRTGRAARPSPG